MSEKIYYCIPCENGDDFKQTETKKEDWSVDCTGEIVGMVEDSVYYVESGPVWCSECEQAVQKIVPPPEELDDDAFAAFWDEEHGESDLLASAIQWRTADPISFELARQEENQRRRAQWEEQQQKEQEP